MFRKPVFWIVLVIILALAGGGYYYYTTTRPKAATITNQVLKTGTVTRGNLVLSASGTGTLIPASISNLAFAKSGPVASISVQVGDIVKAGQVLAKQGNLISLQATLTQDQLALLTAQQAVDDLNNSLESDRANAQAALVTAQKALTDANYSRDVYSNQRCDSASVTLYYGDLVLAQNAFDSVNNDFLTHYTGFPENDPRRINAYNKLYTAQQALAKAQLTYDYCTGTTDTWTTANLKSQAAIAQATYDTAKATLDGLKNGPDPTKMAQAQAKLDSAKNQLVIDQQSLADTTLYSAIDGVVTAINFDVGETASGTFITIADKLHPMVQIYMDETDLNNVGIGYPVNIVFDALPEKTFTGKVTQISPALVTQQGVNYVQAFVTLDDASAAVVSKLPTGMSAAADVIGGQANNALLIPIEALRTLGTNEYAVFVAQPDGSLKLTPVTIGLQDLTQVEIKTGLTAGETVSTGVTTVTTK